jgi:glucan phosphoethanolaminetransferase (alkaline phosphatase superfamily)
MNGILINNPISLLPFSCGLIVLIVGYIKLWNLRRAEHPETVIIFWTWLIGVIALILGIFGQVFTTMETFDTIANANDISPALVASGMKSSHTPTLVGIMVLIISLIVWGILNGLKQKKIAIKKINKEN